MNMDAGERGRKRVNADGRKRVHARVNADGRRRVCVMMHLRVWRRNDNQNI